MAINVSQAFHRTSANPIDDTLALTKAEMLTVNDNLMPAKYITICQDDGQIYLYDKTNTADPTTGKFRVFEGGGGGSDIQVDTLPTASIDELGNIYQYIGVSDANYTNGCFYACVSDGEATPTYSWEMKPVMPSLEASDMADIVTPLPTGGRVTGFTPIGTIIPMIAESAPLYYLKCDGATYNKSDYPELAAHLLSMTNHSMYEVSGDDTKFKVPDLSGEFLRGTGTNSHTDQGSGAAVGAHQDGTANLLFGVDDSTNELYLQAKSHESSGYTYPTNMDSRLTGSGFVASLVKNGQNFQSSDNYSHYTARPTNTSVLYCIATKDIYIDARNIYSTTEKVVGEWINGKPLYQKTIVTTMPSELNVAKLVDIGASVEQTVSINAIMGGAYHHQSLYSSINDFSAHGKTIVYPNSDPNTNEKNKIGILTDSQTWLELPLYVTIQYTKTT